jgi:hypothetical protein
MPPAQLGQTTDYHVVFTVLQKSTPRELFFIVPALVAFATIIALVLVIRRKASLILVGVVYVIFLLMAVVVSPFPGVQDMYARAKDAYVRGNIPSLKGLSPTFTRCPTLGIKWKHSWSKMCSSRIRIMSSCHASTTLRHMAVRFVKGCACASHIQEIAS